MQANSIGLDRVIMSDYSNKVLITNIQRFSLHDGPGIRTTVFFKGCSIRCPWCSNPENISTKIQEYNIGSLTGVYGKWYTIEELFKECIKDKAFYAGRLSSSSEWSVKCYEDFVTLPGGVTFSGGECLLQMPALMNVCDLLHQENVHIAVETSLYVPIENLKMSLSCIDLYYIDVKILSEHLCRKIENADVALFLSNLDYIFGWSNDKGLHKPIVIRIPIIGTYTDSDDHLDQLVKLLVKYKARILKIELIKEHNLAERKYRSLNLNHDYHGVDENVMSVYKHRLESALGLLVEICRV